jgi:hypothetical protein
LKEEKQPASAAKEEKQPASAAKEEKQPASAAKEEKQPASAAKEEKQPASAAWKKKYLLSIWQTCSQTISGLIDIDNFLDAYSPETMSTFLANLTSSENSNAEDIKIIMSSFANLLSTTVGKIDDSFWNQDEKSRANFQQFFDKCLNLYSRQLFSCHSETMLKDRRQILNHFFDHGFQLCNGKHKNKRPQDYIQFHPGDMEVIGQEQFFKILVEECKFLLEHGAKTICQTAADVDIELLLSSFRIYSSHAELYELYSTKVFPQLISWSKELHETRESIKKLLISCANFPTVIINIIL